MQDLVVNERLTIPSRDLRWRFSRSSGPGGQGVNPPIPVWSCFWMWRTAPVWGHSVVPVFWSISRPGWWRVAFGLWSLKNAPNGRTVRRHCIAWGSCCGRACSQRHVPERPPGRVVVP